MSLLSDLTIDKKYRGNSGTIVSHSDGHSTATSDGKPTKNIKIALTCQDAEAITEKDSHPENKPTLQISSSYEARIKEKSNFDGGLENLSIIEFLKNKNISVRLEHICANGKFPYKTVRDYLEDGPRAINKLLKVTNLGRKTALEFQRNIDEAMTKNEPCPESISSLDDSLGNLSIIELLKNKNISVRLEHICANGKFPYKTVRDYLEDGPRAINKLLKVTNLGRKTALEFQELIDSVKKKKDLFSKKELKVDDAPEKPNINKIVNELSEILKERDFKILVERTTHNLTLEEIGRGYGITRERARQIIDHKIVSKYKRLYLDESITIYNQIICKIKEKGGGLEIKDIATSFSCGVKDFRIFIYLHKESINKNLENVAVDNSYIFIEPEHETKQTWKTKIRKEFFSSDWPISLKNILTRTQDIPPFFVTNYLKNKYGVRFQKGLLESGNIPLVAKYIFMFRKEKRPLHISEATRIFNKLFNSSISQRLVSTTLGRLEETLVVDIGTYNTYENLKFSESNIAKIRDETYHYLMDKNKFMSNKVIFEDLFNNYPKEWDQEFNRHMLHGIVQDDKRFLTRPGFMVGLKTFKEKSFKFIEEEIIDFLVRNRPATLKKIHNEFLKTRFLANDTIKRTILKSKNIIEVDNDKYDLLCGVFASENDYEDFVLQIQIILLSGPQSFQLIIEKVNNVSSFNLNPCVIRSILSSLTAIKLNNGICQNDTISNNLRLYDKVIKNALGEGTSVKAIKAIIENIKNTLTRKPDRNLFEKYFKMDPRFNLQVNDKSYSIVSKNSELNKILREFNF